MTVAVSLADKLDSIIHFFAVGLTPTGSKDPFALRRSVLGAISLILENALRLPLSNVVGHTYWQSLQAWLREGRLNIFSEDIRFTSFDKNNEPIEEYGRLYDAPRESECWDDFFRYTLGGYDVEQVGLYWFGAQAKQGLHLDRTAVAEHVAFLGSVASIIEAIIDFFADRLKVQQKEAGVRHDLIDAVFALGGEDDLVRLLARVKALQSFIATDDGTNLLAGYKRAANILKKEGVETAEKVELTYTPEPAEADLIAALDTAEPHATAAVQAEDFEGAMAALATLRAPIDAFFDKVTVNDADPDKRSARLALLARVRDAVHAVADFSKIAG